MTYLAFHLVFILPPILLLAALARRERSVGTRELGHLALVGLIALVYTTPWDNYLVWRGIWSYGEDRVIGTIGYVPVEEYLFFLLQPLLTGLWLLRVDGPVAPGAGEGGAGARWVGFLVFLGVTLVGVLALRSEAGTYLGLILAWAGPALAGQWGYAGRELWARRRAWLLGFGVPTLYLWVADAIALRLGIWRISTTHTLGPALLGLPLEEATFFLVTNLLVVQGLLLFRHAPGTVALGRPSLGSA